MAGFLRFGLTGLCFAAHALAAQSTPATPDRTEFEVASIKPAASDATGRWIRMLSTHEFAARNHALKTLIAAAYDLSPQAISGGPAWVESAHFDIVAKTPGDVRPTLDQQMAMLRSLLSERFGLAFHRESKELRVYALTAAKGGPKLKESTAVEDHSAEGARPALVFVARPNWSACRAAMPPWVNWPRCCSGQRSTFPF